MHGASIKDGHIVTRAKQTGAELSQAQPKLGLWILFDLSLKLTKLAEDDVAY